MSDDLVKELRTTKLFEAGEWESGLGLEAADHIEEADRAIANLQREYDKRGDRIEALERERSLWRNECWMMREAWVEQKAALAAMTADRNDLIHDLERVKDSETTYLNASIQAEARNAKLVEALKRSLNFMENHESDWGITLGSADHARATLAEIGEL